MEDTAALARQIGRVQPRNVDELLVRHDALHWLLLDSGQCILDDEGRRAFLRSDGR